MIGSHLETKDSEAQSADMFYLQSPSNLVSEVGYEPWLSNGNLLPLAHHGHKELVRECRLAITDKSMAGMCWLSMHQALPSCHPNN